MADPHADQRLAAILAADVAGYSRLMEADERATVATLDAYRAVFQERVAGHGGRIVDTAGDSVLAVFPSAIGAVEAAIEIQDELGRRNETLPEDQRMHFRLGVNLGDVIEKDDGSVYGSGNSLFASLRSAVLKPSVNQPCSRLCASGAQFPRIISTGGRTVAPRSIESSQGV